MKADIIAVGTELLMGELVDTNSAYLAARLPAMGIELQGISAARDDLDALVAAFRLAQNRSDLILTTGGLGPTDDDLTREAIAQLLGEALYTDPDALAHLEETFRQRGMAMANANVKQANIIPSGQVVHNAMGTAPGWWVEKDGKIIVAMPGPPFELQRMWEVEVQPRLAPLATGPIIKTRSLKTYGLGESAINEMIAPLFHLPDAELGMYAQWQGVQIRIRVRAHSDEEAERLIQPVEQELRQRLGDNVWGADDQVLEEQMGEELKRRGLTLATMESCTGGFLAHTITQVPGSSAYFRGGIVAYTNEVKAEWGVDPALIREHGAVSPQVAEDMARACRERLGADLGIGITGVAGPDELEGQAVGTVHIGLASKDGTLSHSRRYPPQRPLVKQRAAVQALMELWNVIRQTG